MPRYIKDGCYKILDVDHLGFDSDDSDEDSSLEGGSQKKREAVKEFQDVDYTNTKFILQNLAISTPSFTDDPLFSLKARKDVIHIIAHQVCFLCYCALRAFKTVTRTNQISILILGEGFLGSYIVSELEKCGCGPMLRIYSRGDISAEEWEESGFKSDSSIFKLLQGVRPDIIIFNVEVSNFFPLAHQLVLNHIISESAFIITTTFGFQRRKLYNILKTPSIFRTFSEPQQLVADAKAALRRQLYGSDDEEEEDDEEEYDGLDEDEIEVLKEKRRKDRQVQKERDKLAREEKERNNEIIAKEYAAKKALADAHAKGENKDGNEEAKDGKAAQKKKDAKTEVNGDNHQHQHHHEHAHNADKAAVNAAKRAGDLRYMLRLLENFYVIREFPKQQARVMALEALFGFDPALLQAELDGENKNKSGVNSGNPSRPGTSDDVPTIAEPGVYTISVTPKAAAAAAARAASTSAFADVAAVSPMSATTYPSKLGLGEEGFASAVVGGGDGGAGTAQQRPHSPSYHRHMETVFDIMKYLVVRHMHDEFNKHITAEELMELAKEHLTPLPTTTTTTTNDHGGPLSPAHTASPLTAMGSMSPGPQPQPRAMSPLGGGTDLLKMAHKIPGLNVTTNGTAADGISPLMSPMGTGRSNHVVEIDAHGHHIMHHIPHPTSGPAAKPKPVSLTAEELGAIYDIDDNYELYEGPGFDLMRRVDAMEANKKKKKKRPTVLRKQQHQQQGGVGGVGGDNSTIATGMSNATGAAGGDVSAPGSRLNTSATDGVLEALKEANDDEIMSLFHGAEGGGTKLIDELSVGSNASSWTDSVQGRGAGLANIVIDDSSPLQEGTEGRSSHRRKKGGKNKKEGTSTDKATRTSADSASEMSSTARAVEEATKAALAAEGKAQYEETIDNLQAFGGREADKMAMVFSPHGSLDNGDFDSNGRFGALSRDLVEDEEGNDDVLVLDDEDIVFSPKAAKKGKAVKGLAKKMLGRGSEE